MSSDPSSLPDSFRPHLFGCEAKGVGWSVETKNEKPGGFSKPDKEMKEKSIKISFKMGKRRKIKENMKKSLILFGGFK